MREGPNVELRFLISTKTAGLIIGKRGENIKKLRDEYSVTINIPDSNGPERILILDGDVNSVIEIMHSTLKRQAMSLQEDCVDLRLLVHQSQAGCIIGKSGQKIKELREQSILKTLKVYQMLCPDSTDRIVQLVGTVAHVISCLQAICELLEGAPAKGPRQNYDARSFNEAMAMQYGGWCGMGIPSSGSSYGARRSNFANNSYPQSSMLAASLFSGGGATPRSVTQAAVVSQALASGIPPASAAAMLAATGGQNHPGGPTSGPAGDAATAAAMMAAGMMRGIPGTVSMNIIAPTTTTQVSVSNKMIGAIMGRGGTRINQVRKESGADIKISSQDPGVEDRIITITGTPEQIQSAQFYLQLCVKRFGEQS
ncbi:heterolocus tagous nuclear ribonucleoprotein [Echinococcus multilocularis]|uniref:Heterogeneous nuclear ribonucleoprotein n=2 Tax=Echinococcus TaxID=6209 RepID=U6JJH4_ECHGR|nr:Heterogeneous nuclear ribonucleoprotein K [Echinococcus granulosus]EUB58819.1 Heterogeneous nuclear ribonucleoprotein K [Echinococcus granulosus]CDS24225.1 heterogeneous nuclear ribonucleoprotein [Echinococcus granulosus]CDS39793.1 heterolocus tagous nuclear ribonucleoprotein [Echinococcus multilocularis]